MKKRTQFMLTAGFVVGITIVGISILR